ncbi:hypothetical protein ACP272_13370 (plasmid) [Staphylococcus xylosus]|nr:hypothetical protein [Staphylococcus equorum]OEK69655.1 hypothetical protein AST02_06955 [Staphylococcus equorum]
MNWDYVLDIGAKGILTTIVAGVILKFIQRVYDKLKKDRNSDVFEEATTLFISSLMIYLIIGLMNSGLLYLIYEYYKTNEGVVNITAITLILINTITICIPFLYFENLTLLRNKFYLIKREKEPRYELLIKGYDIVNSQGFEINNKIPLLSKINIENWGDYRKDCKRYYDKQIRGYLYEIIYIHNHPIKRFVKIVPKLWTISVLSVPIIYILAIILLVIFGNSLILVWIIMITLMILYIANFIILVHVSTYISKQNKIDQYIGYYKANNLA